jgi:ParB/RepB/Spo0J family partition protein
MEIKQLSVSEVVENPENPRRKLGDIASLVASIDAIGLVEPIVVREVTEGRFIIVSGARRFAACKKLNHETIACIIRANDENADLASIAENTAREALSVDDLAIAVNRLDGLSMSDEELSAALAISAGDVGHARVLAKASKKAKDKLKALTPESRQFTLEESASIVRYASDSDRAEELSDALEYNPEQLPHVIARFEQEDARIAAVEALRASRAGKIEVPPFRSWERPAKGVSEPLHNLATADGKLMTLARHADCQYAGFYIENGTDVWRSSNTAPKLIDYCVDWPAAGHKMREKPKQEWPKSYSQSTTKELTPTQALKAKEERRKVIANNKLWGPATSVRSNWIDSFGLRSELNTKAKQWVLNELILDHGHIKQPSFKGKVTGFEQSFLVVWTQLVAAREEVLKQHTWRPSSYVQPLLDRYFRMLKDQGYPVSEVESGLIRDDAKQAPIEVDEFGDVA